MTNTQINISQNGIVTLATAGKYCDRNIDVNVNVNSGLVPTQFTNILNDINTVITPNCIIKTSDPGEMSVLNGACVVEFTLPAQTPSIFRFRGYIPYNTYVNFSKDGGTTWLVAYFHHTYSSIDEYGDCVWGTTMTTAALPYDILIRVNLCYVTAGANVTAITEEIVRNSGAIMTINEPIGNISVG